MEDVSIMAVIQPKRLKFEPPPASPGYILSQIAKAGHRWGYDQFCNELGLAKDCWSSEKFSAFQDIVSKMSVIFPEILERVYYAQEGMLENDE
jgi:hypothetical protein